MTTLLPPSRTPTPAKKYLRSPSQKHSIKPHQPIASGHSKKTAKQSPSLLLPSIHLQLKSPSPSPNLSIAALNSHLATAISTVTRKQASFKILPATIFPPSPTSALRTAPHAPQPLNINTAEIDGNEIVLAFDRELDSTAPSKGTFRLTANGKAIKIKSINLNADDREATIILKSAVEHADEVFLSYTDPKGNQKRNVIQDIDGNDLASFSSLALTNNTRKNSKDFFVDYADADGSTINLYLTDTLSNSIPNASRFRITANKRRQLISSVSTDPSDGVVTLNLKRPLNTNQDVLIAYRDLNGNQSSGIIEDDDGNDLVSFSNLAPINDTTDNDPPILQDAYVDGRELILEFDELLMPGTINNSRFKVRADKKRIRVTSASIPADDSIAILELKSTIPSSTKELLLTYRDLKGDQSAGIIQDIGGND